MVDATEGKTLTAAEKRAARRARVLEGGDRRLKLLTGQIGSLKESEETQLERALDDGVNELLETTEGVAEKENEVEDDDKNGCGAVDVKTGAMPRVDPAQRRRDAAARRQKKEAMVQEILGGGKNVASAPAEHSKDDEAPKTGSTAISTTEKKTEPAFSRHATALRLQSAEEKLILLIILVAAIYMAFTMDIRNVMTDLLARDPLYLSYEQLFHQGVSVESIRLQMERENLEPSLIQQIEQLFVAQRKSESFSAAPASGFFSSILDLPSFFVSLVSRPPVVVCVMLLRVVLGFLHSPIHRALQLPDVKNPQEDDLGFVMNLALSSRPALKGYIAKSRKSVDDVFFFLWCFIIAVALRAIFSSF
ncbi:hypothetical protein Poli38472_000965 [Pythium oligandrum]|uniref:Transmembrane protein n=1 Tax=Pythium oligandrum TaxID=41045 RepID=A0A8K1CE69_PYTOL|nr:hypothetical protein Poli38472_000965 [Pythium oligandrum]|eukprot:TMW60923.1 hypothetical protein Poli38472_000965 [Pythium oligandrum]